MPTMLVTILSTKKKFNCDLVISYFVVKFEVRDKMFSIVLVFGVFFFKNIMNNCKIL